MKTPEDEAFEDIERRQGGGFPAKRAMAAEKFIAAEERKVGERYGYVPKLHPSEWMDEPAQEPVAHLWECLGRWSVYLVSNGEQAECAPPSWLVDAIQNATTPPLPVQPVQERNFCSRCGKRTAELTTIHTCTPPGENT
jgi:hypothetical protein